MNSSLGVTFNMSAYTLLHALKLLLIKAFNKTPFLLLLCTTCICIIISKAEEYRINTYKASLGLSQELIEKIKEFPFENIGFEYIEENSSRPTNWNCNHQNDLFKKIFSKNRSYIGDNLSTLARKEFEHRKKAAAAGKALIVIGPNKHRFDVDDYQACIFSTISKNILCLGDIKITNFDKHSAFDGWDILQSALFPQNAYINPKIFSHEKVLHLEAIMITLLISWATFL